jgi:alpha-galactosidase
MREKELDYAALRRLISQWRQSIAPNYYGDYYPLTPYSQESSDWIAWQFNRPEAGTGVVQAFRRENSPSTAMRLKLRGLDPDAEYSVTDLDTDKPQVATGGQLMENGLLVSVPDKPGAAVITYKKALR